MPTLSQFPLASYCLAAWSPAGAMLLFEDQAVIEAGLTGPIDALVKSTEARQEFPFVILTDGENLDIDVRVRGKSRVRVCAFSPLRLNFEPSVAAQRAMGFYENLVLAKQARASLGAQRGE